MATKPFTELQDPVKIFEAGAYNSWSDMEAKFLEAAVEAKSCMADAENHLNSLVEEAMDEFFRASHDVNKKSKYEISSRRFIKAVSSASKKYMTAAVASAKNGFSSPCKKIQPC